MDHIKYKRYTIKYMPISRNTHIQYFGRYIKGFFNEGKLKGAILAKIHIDILIKKGA